MELVTKRIINICLTLFLSAIVFNTSAQNQKLSELFQVLTALFKVLELILLDQKLML